MRQSQRKALNGVSTTGPSNIANQQEGPMSNTKWKKIRDPEQENAVLQARVRQLEQTVRDQAAMLRVREASLLHKSKHLSSVRRRLRHAL